MFVTSDGYRVASRYLDDGRDERSSEGNQSKEDKELDLDDMKVGHVCIQRTLNALIFVYFEIRMLCRNVINGGLLRFKFKPLSLYTVE